MVGLLSQMEETDHSMVSNEERSTAASGHSDVSRIEVKSEQSSAEMCQEAERHKDGSEAETVKSDDCAKMDNVNEEEVQVKELKSILKRRGQYTMRKVKVDFDLIPKRIPFDETKDYTIEIQIVDKEPVKIKSWAAIFAAKKAEAEAEEAAAAEAEAAMKKAEELQKREAIKRANKAKKAKTEADKKNDEEEQQQLEKSKTEGSAEDTKNEQLNEEQMASEEDSNSTIGKETQEEDVPEMLREEPTQPNANVEEITGLSESDKLNNSNVEEISVVLESENESQKNSNDEEELDQLHEVTGDEVSEQLSEEVKGVVGDFHPLPEDADLEDKSLISTDDSRSEGGIFSINVSEQMSEEVKGGGSEFHPLPELDEKSLISTDDSKSEGETGSTDVSEQLSEEVKGGGNAFNSLPKLGEKSLISTDDSKSEGGTGSADVSEQLSEEVKGCGNAFNSLPELGDKSLISTDDSKSEGGMGSTDVSEQLSNQCNPLPELGEKSLISTDDSKSEGGMGSTDVSEELSEEVKGGGNAFNPLPESSEKSLISKDDSKSKGGTDSIGFGPLEKLKLPEEVLVTAVSLVEDILAETPVILKAISFDEDSATECLSASVDISELRYFHNEDRTESSIEELPSEGHIESLSNDLENVDTGVSQRSSEPPKEIAEEVQYDANYTTELINVETKTKNAIASTTDEHRAKANNIVVSKKLNESLKKASPEIIKSAVRVLVEIEKVTLAVVKNLEPLVP